MFDIVPNTTLLSNDFIFIKPSDQKISENLTILFFVFNRLKSSRIVRIVKSKYKRTASCIGTTKVTNYKFCKLT